MLVAQRGACEDEPDETSTVAIASLVGFEQPLSQVVGNITGGYPSLDAPCKPLGRKRPKTVALNGSDLVIVEASAVQAHECVICQGRVAPVNDLITQRRVGVRRRIVSQRHIPLELGVDASPFLLICPQDGEVRFEQPAHLWRPCRFVIKADGHRWRRPVPDAASGWRLHNREPDIEAAMPA